MSSMIKFSEGDWIQWVTPHRVMRGQVVMSKGPSIIVRWLSGEEQVFPVYEQYVSLMGDDRMERIERPKEALRIARDASQGRMTIARAAASLGKTPKAIRAMLRSGQLKGVQVDGKWTHVEL